MRQELSFEQRSAILEREIAKWSKRGYQVVSQTLTTAQLVRPKRFSCLAATLWTLLLGIGLIFYLFYYMGKKDDIIYLSIDERGHIRKR